MPWAFSLAAAEQPTTRGIAQVSGRVLLDGLPLQEGRITFLPDGVAGTVAGGKIDAGAYHLSRDDGPVIGRNKVEIRSVQKTGRLVKATVIPEGAVEMTEGQLVEEYLDVVPAQYNQNTTLVRELKAGKNQLDFELSSTSP